MKALEAKVGAVNRANDAANRWGPVLRESVRPFVGAQVVKKAGGLLDKVKKALPTLPNDAWLQVYRHVSDYSLAWTFKSCVMIGETHGCLYHEVTVYVGKLSHGVLTELESSEFKGRTDYTVDEVLQKRAAYESAKKAADDARSNLHPFGEYDR